MQISAQQATVKTVQVEIQTMVISNKQVTQAVFRQLDTSPLINYETQTLNGLVWGRINYHPDRCGDDHSHLHIVWQKGAKLFRDAVYYDKSQDIQAARTLLRYQAEFVLFSASGFGIGDIPIDKVNMKLLKEFGSGYMYSENLHSTSFRMVLESIAVEHKNGQNIYSPEDINGFFQKEIGEFLRLKVAYDSILKFHQELYSNLESLDQLFIAV